MSGGCARDPAARHAPEMVYRYPRRVHDGPFGLPWFWKAVAVILAATVLALAVLVFVNRSLQERVAAVEAANYTPPPVTLAPTIAVLGDSWSCGWGVHGHTIDDADGFVGLTANDLGGWFWVDACVPNTGYTVNGDKQTYFIDRVSQVTARKPDVIVVQGSTNDYASTAANIEQRADAVFAAIRRESPKSKVFALLAMYTPGSATTDVDRERQAVTQAAKANDVTVIDGAAQGWLNLNTDFADSIHPNAAGHAKIAKRLAAVLKQDVGSTS